VNGDRYRTPRMARNGGLCDHQQFGAGDATGWLGRLDSNRNIREIAPSLIRY